MIRVLIADDHAIMRDGLRQILAECVDMVVVGEASNGNEVMDSLREPDFDVLVLDMTMPGKSGIDLIRHIKSTHPKLPTLILSMHHESQFAIRSLKAGASGYLCKDVAGIELISAIRKVADGGLYVNNAMAELLALELNSSSQDISHRKLSNREYEIFYLLAVGMNITEISAKLNLSVKTVSTHKTRLMQKMHFNNLSELIRYALSQDLIGSDISSAN